MRTRKARLALSVIAVTTFGAVFSSGAYGAIAFSNGTDITIPGGAPATTSGNADPYPSSINVSGLLGLVAKATVTVTNISHTWPDDIDILLSGPAGQTTLLMSDTGGSTDITNVTLTFDDLGAALPDGGTIVSGTRRPTNFEAAVDTFPGPAPAPPFGSTLGTFTGIDPNGTWSLWVRDDENLDVGAIDSWTLTLDGPVLAPGTPPPPPPPTPTPTPVPLASGPCANTQRGTNGSDTLVGTARGDRLVGRGGRDVLRGRRGRDCLFGQGGRDRLFGGPGNDRLVGGPGRDLLNCGAGGNDVAIAGSNDVVRRCERVRRR